ncbi:MAG: DMT family transporter [Bacteroidales bacterium]
MQKNKTLTGAGAVALASVMWGFDGVVLTPRLYNLDVVFVVFLLHLIPFILMQFFLPGQYRYLRKFDYKDILTLFLIAMFGGILGTVSIVRALFLVHFDQLSVVVLLQKLQPVFSILLAWLILGERMRKGFTLWASIAIIASYFLVFGLTAPNLHTAGPMAEAALWALLAAFSFGSSTVFSKRILLRYSFFTGTFYRYGFSTVILLLAILFSGKMVMFRDVTANNWIFLLIIAFTTGSGAIFLYYFGLTRIRAMLSTMTELFFPLSAILFDYFINGKMLTAVQWIAAIIMILAIVRLSLDRPEEKKIT